MPPNSRSDQTCTGVLYEEDVETVDGGLDRDVRALKEAGDRDLVYIWPNIVVMVSAHIMGLYGLQLVFTSARVYTTLYMLTLHWLSIVGISAGVHRLYAHRAYKARLPLRLILVVFSTIAHQNSVFHWAREHRVHHKYSETNADPLNATRGFFFAHVGWLFVKKHPDVRTKGKTVDVSDMLADPILQFQHKYYAYCTLVMSILLPLLVPIIYWNETWTNAFFVTVMLRWVCTLNAVWLVNSAAHIYGSKPYDANINPSENPTVSFLTSGEGFHNYHHTFPWDYKTSELGSPLNFSKVLIDFCASIGLAYDLKTVSPAIVKQRMLRTGDGTKNLWGWGDLEQDPKQRAMADVLHARAR